MMMFCLILISHYLTPAWDILGKLSVRFLFCRLYWKVKILSSRLCFTFIKWPREGMYLQPPNVPQVSIQFSNYTLIWVNLDPAFSEWAYLFVSIKWWQQVVCGEFQPILTYLKWRHWTFNPETNTKPTFFSLNVLTLVFVGTYLTPEPGGSQPH